MFKFLAKKEGSLIENRALYQGRALIFIIIHFLQTHPDNLTIIEITGTQRLENGLAGPGKFIAFTNSAAIGTKIKRTAGTWR